MTHKLETGGRLNLFEKCQAGITLPRQKAGGNAFQNTDPPGRAEASAHKTGRLDRTASVRAS